ncbi:MAG: signal recognition particle-docking protein FtsY [bacterium]|nr:signal recognition particle-docking protein FtsY [bacterium]
MDTGTLLVAAGVAVLAVVLAVILVRHRGGRLASSPEAAPPALGGAERLRRGLLATRERLLGQIDAVLGRGPRPLEAILADLEEVLIAADVGVPTTAALLEHVRAAAAGSADPAVIRDLLRCEIAALVETAPAPLPSATPWVTLVVGVNGVGKTTTIGKLATHHTQEGRKVLIVAADTFRAAAIEQLTVWAERSGADLVRHAAGADPSAVVYDGIRAAVARGIDVVLVDTAGRLHTRSPLMDELKKIRRVIARELPGAPHETLLVLDATTGQNALNQARTFGEAVEVTGVALTKLDGTARGGILLALRHELGLPVHWIGVGEAPDDLRPFDPAAFVAAVLGSADGR